MTESRELVRRLGTFLADLTKDRRAERIHAEIIERLRDPGLALDHRLAGVYLQDKDFIPIWTAIRNGAALPATSWETVVLPTVVHFSTEASLKGNLEIAASLFLAAREAVTAPAELTASPSEADTDHQAGLLVERHTMPVPATPPELDALLQPAPAIEPAPAGTERRGRRLLALAGLAVAAAAAIYFLPGPGQEGQAHSRLVPPATTLSPTPLPEISPSPSPQPSMSEAPTSPSPSLSPSQRIVPPSAPRKLASTAKTRTSVSLTWLAPSEPGTGGLDRYRIFANGAEVARTDRTSDTVLNLSPGTAYTFMIKAYSKIGRESPASNAVTVRTLDPPPPTVSAPASVDYGMSFSVTGALWRCAAVNIYLGSHHVGTTKPDADGDFVAGIAVYRDENKLAVVDIVGGGRFHLNQGTWAVKASCGTVTAGPVSVTIRPEPV